jgi:hypothetical protein
MRVFTGNVFITKSLPAIQQLHDLENTKVKSFREQLENLSDSDFKNSFIASPLKNEGLLHFEYSFTANSKKNGGSIVILRLLETSKLLELFLLENDPLTRIIEAKEKAIGRIELGAGGTRLSGMNYENKLKRSARYYFSFGEGDDINKWSGPYAMQLAGATLKNDKNNVRTIEVTFISNTETMKTWSPKFGAMFTSSEQFKNLGEFVPPDARLSIGSTRRFPLFTDKQDPSTKSKTFSLELNSIITNLFKSYINQLTKNPGNSVVVIPQNFGLMKVTNDSTALLDMEAVGGRRADLRHTTYSANPINVSRLYPGPNQPFKSTFTSTANKDGTQRISASTSFFTQKDLESLGISFEFSKTLEAAKAVRPAVGLAFLRKVGKDSRDLAENIFKKELNDQEEKLVKEIASRKKQNIDREEKRIIEEEEELFIKRTQALRDSRIAEATDKKNNTIASETAKINEFKDFLNNQSGGIPRRILKHPQYGNFIKELEYSGAPPPWYAQAQALGYPPISNNNLRPLLLIAADVKLQKITELENKKEQDKITSANRSYEMDIAPGSRERNSFSKWRAPALREKLQNSKNLQNAAAEGENLEGVSSLRKTFEERKSVLNHIDKKLTGFFQFVEDHGFYGNSLADAWRQRYLTFSIEASSEVTKEGYEGFTALVAPLIRFGSKVKDIQSIEGNDKYSEFDFYEETNIKILKLWKKYGIIDDASKPAYVFGSMKDIRKMLYLEGPGEVSKQAISNVFAMNSLEQFALVPEQLGKGTSNVLMAWYQDNTPRQDIYKDGLAKHKKYVEDFRTNFPVSKQVLSFRHNISNPNVTALEYRLDNYIAALTNMPVNPTIDKSYLGTTRVAAVKELAKSAIRGKVIEKLSKIKGNTVAELTSNSLKGETAGELALTIAEDPALLASKDKNFLDLFSMLLVLKDFDTLSEKAIANGYYTILKPGESRFDQYFKAMLNYTSKLLYKFKLKTTPMFHKLSYLKQPCTLTGLTNSLIGVSKVNEVGSEVDPITKGDPAPYNGEYTIMGYRHVISTSEMFSEFDIYRKGHENKDVLGTASIGEILCQSLKNYLNAIKNYSNKQSETYSTKIQPLNDIGLDDNNGSWTNGWILLKSLFTGDVNATQIVEGVQAARSVKSDEDREAWAEAQSINENLPLIKRINEALKSLGCLEDKNTDTEEVDE